MAESTFVPGATLRVREVLHGAERASWDEHVVSDDEGVLACVQSDGTPMSFPPHATPHPWGHLDAWTGTTVLKLRRDVQDLAPSLASGRITQEELLPVLAAATEVADLLDRDDRWWTPWDDWTPAGGRIAP